MPLPWKRWVLTTGPPGKSLCNSFWGKKSVYPAKQSIHPALHAKVCSDVHSRRSPRSTPLQTIRSKHHSEQCSNAVALNHGHVPPRGHLVIPKDVSDHPTRRWVYSWHWLGRGWDCADHPTINSTAPVAKDWRWSVSHSVLTCDPWTVACPAPLSMEFSNTGVGSHSLLQGIKPRSPALQVDSLPTDIREAKWWSRMQRLLQLPSKESRRASA